MRVTALAAAVCLSASVAGAAPVCLAKVSGAIGPATASFLARSIDHAAAQGAQCLIVQLNTPGGLLDSTQIIVQKFLASPLPVVVYVAPTGGTATSAGCFITLAADVAAMAPATTIGAAHPVAIGGAPAGTESRPDETMTKKLENFAVSYIEAVATKRGRNVEWAKSAVAQSASITADKALELKVIEIIADSQNALLEQLDGRVIKGKPLQTAGAQLTEIGMSASETVFQALWRPEVMYILMLIAIYGLIGELSSPGAILPGVIGAIALVLALYMAAILPVNVAGLLLIALAVLLLVVDVFAPTHGVLTVGGIIAFLLGSLMLFDRSDPLFQLSLAYVIPAVILTAAFFVFAVGQGVRAQWLPVKVGSRAMVGERGNALTPIDSAGGKIFVQGEYWNARSDTPIQPGSAVRVIAVEGLSVRVQPLT
jgi:membrane-bound serine protease (ClpP class)